MPYSSSLLTSSSHILLIFIVYAIISLPSLSRGGSRANIQLRIYDSVILARGYHYKSFGAPASGVRAWRVLTALRRLGGEERVSHCITSLPSLPLPLRFSVGCWGSECLSAVCCLLEFQCVGCDLSHRYSVVFGVMVLSDIGEPRFVPLMCYR